MTGLFLKMLDISITAGWIVVAVVLLRLLLTKAPKWIRCLLWGIVALRLILPVFPESEVSLIPDAEILPRQTASVQAPAVQDGEAVAEVVQTQEGTSRENRWETFLPAASVVWVVGTAVILLYGLVSYVRLQHQVQASLLLEEQVYSCDQVESPFILGFFRPRIYVPSGMEEPVLRCVLAHERAHIRRKDHWWKPIGFILLAVYWFHPLLWFGYILLCRDIEQACDEKAVANMDDAEKKQYSQALVLCSIPRQLITACPVAFGEVRVKERIKNILSYRKPAFWIVAVSVAVCAVTAVCFLTDPKTCQHEYAGQITAESTCVRQGAERFTCAKCSDSYTVPIPTVAHSYDEGTVTVSPTCVQCGTKERTCTACGAKATETLPKTDHTVGLMTVTKASSCTETGLAAVTCSVCSTVFDAELPTDSQAHSMQETVVRTATCTAAGEGKLTCIHCNYTETCTYPRHSHNFVDQGLLLKTCYIHKRQQVCTHCNLVRTVELNDYGHNWVNGKCSVCHAKQPGGTALLRNP